MSDLTLLGIEAAAAGLAAGEFTAEDLLTAYLARIEAREPALNCFITPMPELAVEQARASDLRRRDGRGLSPLDGLPIALKDNIHVAGVPTSNGMARYRTPGRDAEVVRRLKAAGAVLLGKLNMHEGALGGTTDNHHHGPTHNPWRQGHTPAGSSGGSGAAVAARLCIAALGTDTLGSVRLPAAYCGVGGFKATTGLVSTRGVVPLSYQLDHVGPLCRSVHDLRAVLAVLAGPDRDSPESVHPHGALEPTAGDLAGAKVAVLPNVATSAVEDGVRARFEEAVTVLHGLGARLVEVELPEFDAIRARLAGFLISEAEAAFALDDILTRRPECLSRDFWQMLQYGREAPAWRLVAAQRRVAEAGLAVRHLFEEIDFLISPTAPQTAFAFDRPAPVDQADFTQLANYGRCPAISLPCGLSADDLPVGLQIMAPPFADGRLLAVAETVEAALPAMPAPPE
ncbi:MAG: amidase [Alphaproteobacteria bacterium]|jgi:aspartyl-tRNA(Asn)/glutamyl-tRNA(Gln) amidotransferase subunit A|nr:amidase [Alphaproteobacteria bacterium]MDP6565438.1 amidase [Alphaproteobacteria bacterium]MDP6814465.1 amidase [Alphaproteobacteria bacterium]